MKIAERILSLRDKAEISQEKLAEKLNVTRQSVQKWESGKAIPSVDILIKLSKLFGVSLDSLILDVDQRKTGSYVNDYKINFNSINEWKLYSKKLDLEYIESTEEGKDIEKYKDLLFSIYKLEDSQEKEDMADALFRLINDAKTVKNYKYVEPNDYDEIQKLKDDFCLKKASVKKSELKNKISGGWYGRIAGCSLGKPIECALSCIEKILKMTNNYPLKRYIYSSDLTKEVREETGFPFPDNIYFDQIDYAPVDDDTNYTVLAQILIDRYGKNFTSENVINNWVTLQPECSYCTAEIIAYRNYLNGFIPPNTATYKNPCRELIGAQIRGDYYGYINPGNPHLAAKMAYKDAYISHVKNGIYGEMFISAMIATAFISNDPEEIIKSGLHEIPKTCRLYEYIVNLLKDVKNGVKDEKILQKIHKDYCDKTKHGEIHTISNAAIVCLNLMRYPLDYAKGICSTVQMGYDTDCNGATLGSILGIMLGKNNIPEYWTKPFNGKLFAVNTMYKIEDLINKTLTHIDL